MNDSRTVLVVEDEEDSRESLKEWLELEGFQVAAAANGQEALAFIEDHCTRLHPCVVLLDLFMPVLDGWGVLDRLSANGLLSKVTVIVTTSAPHRAPSGFRVLSKPVDLDALVYEVRRAPAPH